MRLLLAAWRLFVRVATYVDDSLQPLNNPPADHPVWRGVPWTDCKGRVEGDPAFCAVCAVLPGVRS